MPQSIACPSCGKKVRVPDERVGKRVKCPACGEPFVATPMAAGSDPALEPLPAEPIEDEPAERPQPVPDDEADAWANVRTAFSVQGAAHVLYFLGTMLLFFTVFILMLRAGSTSRTPTADSQLADRFFGLCLVLGGLTVTASWAASVVANCFGASAPVSRGARPLALAGAAASGLVVLKMAGLLVVPFGDHDVGGPLGRTVVGPLLGLASGTLMELVRLVVMALYARSVGRLLRDRTLANLGLYLALATAALYLLVVFLDMFIVLVDDPSKKSDSRALQYLSLFLHALPLLVVQLAGAALLLKGRQTVTRRLPED